MTVIWAWLVEFITEILKKFQGLAQITAFLNTPKGCSPLQVNPCSVMAYLHKKLKAGLITSHRDAIYLIYSYYHDDNF